MTVRLSAQRTTVASSISSTLDGGASAGPYSTPRRVTLRPMAEPSIRDIDALVGPATPHFAYQLRARVRELIEDLPADHPVRRYGEEKMELLDRSGTRPRRPRTARASRARGSAGSELPSSAPAYDPLPAAVMSFDGRLGPRDRRLARDRQGDRAPLRRRSAPRASRSATCAPTRPPRRRPRSCAALGAEPMLVRGNVSSERVLEEVARSGRSTCSSTTPPPA